LSAVLGTAVFASQAPAPQPSSPTDPAVAAPGVATPEVAMPGIGMPGAAAPDDDLIEFLGADDVGDADWWEFLKKSWQIRDQTRMPPPQDAQQ
jgi:hypothetical protein